MNLAFVVVDILENVQKLRKISFFFCVFEKKCKIDFSLLIV